MMQQNDDLSVKQALRDAGEPITVAALMEKLNMSRNRIARALQRLEVKRKAICIDRDTWRARQ